uniref:Alpha-1,3-mannosyl-glycoprotein 2-beta-N-acetylglucosaminyltransferase n=1 Tax=Knipowitschia caucasica TaxID=637954 RepID=A0AAV2K1L3_KNICA
MVRKKGSFILCGAFLFVAWNALLLLYLWGRPPMGRLGEGGGAEPVGKEEWGVRKGKSVVGSGGGDLAGEVMRLAEEVEVQLEKQKELLRQIESHRAQWARQKDIGKREMGNSKAMKVDVTFAMQLTKAEKEKTTPKLVATTTPQLKLELTNVPQSEGQENTLVLSTARPEVVIPILVIACDRVTVKRSLDRLVQYRPSPQLHPIIVSQDCGHADTARVIDSYGEQLTHIRQPELADIRVRPEHRKFQGYYKIARHYRWALNQIFNTFGYSNVVIVEDDLEISHRKCSG